MVMKDPRKILEDHIYGKCADAMLKEAQTVQDAFLGPDAGDPEMARELGCNDPNGIVDVTDLHATTIRLHKVTVEFSDLDIDVDYTTTVDEYKGRKVWDVTIKSAEVCKDSHDVILDAVMDKLTDALRERMNEQGGPED